jgi:primosomal protein N' (replication factor Y)
MLTKGLDFKHLTLVGVLLADGTLQLPDFRASERTYQLLEQVAGRSGRGEAEGEVIIQTFQPAHYAIQAVALRDPEKFILKELEHRKKWGYPPFCQLINLTVRGRKEEGVVREIEKLKKALEELNASSAQPIEILGPAPMPFYRLRGYFRWHLMVKGKDLGPFKKALTVWLDTHRFASQCYLEIDVDPVHIL